MLNNVKDFGAIGDGVADDRESIQAAVNAAVVGTAAGIFFPAGVYRVGRSRSAGARWSIELKGARDFGVIGEGARSIVRLMDEQGPTRDWHVFVLRGGCRRVTFSDLVIDGNRLGLNAPDEQSHGIEVEAGTEDLTIDRCVLRDCFGDGVRLLGQGGPQSAPVRRVRISNCLFTGNKRSGLGVQRAVQQLIVSHCHFDGTVTDADIDFEPTGSLAPSDALIDGCQIEHANKAVAVSLSGTAGADPMLRCRFVNNHLNGGEVFCTDVAQLAVQNNTIVVPASSERNRVPLQVQRGGESLLITGNIIEQGSARTEAAIAISEVNGRQVSRALIQSNLCAVSAGSGIVCLSSDDVDVQGNLIIASGEAKSGVLVRSESSQANGVSVRDCSVSVRGTGAWQFGVRVVATDAHGVGDIAVIGNTIKGARTGVAFEGRRYANTPMCALNRCAADVVVPLSGIELLPEAALVVGASVAGTLHGASAAGSRHLAGFGDPNGRVAGGVGDTYIRIDGGPGSCLFVKESSAGSTAGWSAK